MGWSKRKIEPTPRRTPARAYGCPTCGGGHSVVTVRKGGRTYVKGMRVYWPKSIGWRGRKIATCDDPYHSRHGYYDNPAKLDCTEQEHVANLPHVGPPPLSDEARERAAATQSRNRVRQGKDNR